MKKILLSLILIVLCFYIQSCSYEYEMPDYSNARPTYKVEMPSDVRSKLWWDATARAFRFSGEHDAEIQVNVREKDANGNILYDGEPRKKADHNAVTLEVYAIGKCRLKNSDWHYYDICIYDFAKHYPLEISPRCSEVTLAESDAYTVTKHPNYPAIFTINSSQLPTLDKCHELGYNIADVILTVTGKSENGNRVLVSNYNTQDGIIVTDEFSKIDIEKKIIGLDSRNNKVDVGEFYFKDVVLDREPKVQNIILTTDMDNCEFVEYNRAYNYNINWALPLNEKCYELGYELADCKTYITEKDATGNVLRTFEHRTIDGYIQTSEARTVDVEVKIIGFDYRKNKVDVGSYIFKGIDVQKINNTTYTITTDKDDYEFIEYNRAYNYNVGINLPTIDKCHELGYDIADVQMYITEKDANGKVLRTFKHRTIDGKIQTSEARTIDVEVRIIGFDSRNNKKEVGSYFFKGISVVKINNTTYTLTTDLDYSFIEKK